MNNRYERDNHQPDYEDLTVIKGIGQARQQWLREQMSVRTMGDLAALTADDLESLLRAEGRIISRGEIDGWLDEARQFATAHIPQTHTPTSPPTASAEAVASATIAASFVIEIEVTPQKGGLPLVKTIAHHVETDHDESWTALLPPALQQWMLQRVPVEDEIEAAVPAWGEHAAPSSGALQFGAFSERLVSLLERTGAPLPEQTPIAAALTDARVYSERLTTLLSRGGTPAGSTAQTTEEVYQFSPRLQGLMSRMG